MQARIRGRVMQAGREEHDGHASKGEGNIPAVKRQKMVHLHWGNPTLLTIV
jgi:hypothetical protein